MSTAAPLQGTSADFTLTNGLVESPFSDGWVIEMPTSLELHSVCPMVQ